MVEKCVKHTCGDVKGREDNQRQNWGGTGVWRAGRGKEPPKEHQRGAAREGGGKRGEGGVEKPCLRKTQFDLAEAKQEGIKESTKFDSRAL